MSKLIQAFLDRGEFSLPMHAQIQFQRWESGFDAFYEGRPLNHMEGKHQRQGWLSGQKLTTFQERLEHDSHNPVEFGVFT